jgi:hypothetical protein
MECWNRDSSFMFRYTAISAFDSAIAYYLKGHLCVQQSPVELFSVDA